MSSRVQTKTPESVQTEANETQPYAPSILDRFMNWVKQLPVPYWVTYLTLFIVEGVVNHVFNWADGWLPAFTFSPISLLFPFWLWGSFAIITYLNSISLEALSSFRPLLDVSDKTMRRLEYEFTTMPSRGVIISGGFWAIWYCGLTFLAFDGFYRAFGLGTFITVLTILEGLITFLTGSVIYYHSIRQLRLIDKVVKMVKEFDLFQLEPVYAFSIVTSRTGIAWVILLSITLLLFPIDIAFIPTLIILIVQVVLALAAFFLPLRIVNRRLVAEKRRLLAEHNQRVQSTLARLHRRLDDNELVGMDQLNDALAGLTAEGKLLAEIPTWPWRAGLFTGFLSIVVLPIILFIIQVVLGRWLER
jgi:hypothetical protein